MSMKSAKACRLCFSNGDLDDLQPIFENQDFKIALSIFLCTSVKIIDLEQFPAMICSSCLKDLKNAECLRSNAIKNDRIFQSHLESLIEKNKLSIFEPEVSIKLENEARIKTEPDESNFDMLQNIDTIIENCTIFEDSSTQRFVDEDNNSDVRESDDSGDQNKKKKHKKRKKSRDKKCKKIDEDFSLYCEVCKQFFTTRASLQKHMKVKHDYADDRYFCDSCGSFFALKYYLLRHIKTHHSEDQHSLIKAVEKNKCKPPVTDSPIPCDVCGKILRNRGLLKPHMRSHKTYNLEDYYYCDLCPRKFKTRGGCVWHIQQRHILKATFSCPQCPAVYKGKWELKCHIKSKHTDIRDYRCEICGKGFLDKQKLTIHTRIHTGERPHACHICPQRFIHQTDLRRHVWGHTGQRPYRCQKDGCGKGFMKKSELLSHENRCHPENQQLRAAATAVSLPQQFQQQYQMM